MRIFLAVALIFLVGRPVIAAAPEATNFPPHPRLWIGGEANASGYIDPAGLAARAKARPKAFALLGSSSVISARALSGVISGDAAKIAGVAEQLKSARGVGAGNLVNMALAYDWIAPSLSEADRKAIAARLGDLAQARLGEAESRFNPWDNNPLRRDMGIGLVGLAIAGDDPRGEELYKTSNRLFEEFLVLTGDGVKLDGGGDPMSQGSAMYGRGMYGGGWPEGHDYDRHGSRYAMLYFLGVRSATGRDVFTGSRFWQDKILEHIYIVLPNGHNLLPFQDNDNPFLHRYDREVMLVLARDFKEPHARWYLNHVNTEQDSSSAVMEFLFNEPDEAEHDFSDLPLAHHIPGTGRVFARSGWGPNDTYVAFCASDWYVYHQNNAQNVFAIYRNAPLAVKDGVYSGSVDEHYVNYTIRTISYNGMTVYDPSEFYGGSDGFKTAANDGGQMIQQWRGNPKTFAEWREQARRRAEPMRDIVDWLDFETNDKYTYMAAEAGRAYKPGKVPFFSRQVLFVYPNWVIVFDRVTSGDAAFEKTFHLHAPEEMEVGGREAIITTKTTNHTTIPGRLFVKSLLPKDADVKRVDGIAMVRGKSWPYPEKPYNDQVECPHHLEITAPKEKETCFLTAMYACDADVESAPKAEIVEETPDKVTVNLGGDLRVSFSKTGETGWKME